MADFHVIRGTSIILAGQQFLTLTEGTDYTLETGPAGTKVIPLYARVTNTRFMGKGPSGSGGSTSIPHVDYGVVNATSHLNMLTFILWSRGSATATYDCEFSWEIVQYIGEADGPNAVINHSSGFAGQHPTTTGETPVQTISVTSYDTDRTMPLLTGQVAGGHTSNPIDRWGTGLWYGEILSSTTWKFLRLDDGSDLSPVVSGIVSWSILEFTGSNWSDVRKEQFDLSDLMTTLSWSPATQQFSAFNLSPSVAALSRTFFHMQYATDNNPCGLDDAGDSLYLSSVSQVRIRHRNTAGTRRYTLWILENSATGAGAMDVEHLESYRGTTAAGANVFRIVVGATVDADQACIMGESASSDGGGTATPRGSCDARLLQPTLDRIGMYQEDGGQETWHAVQLLRWPCDPTDMNGRGHGAAHVRGGVHGAGEVTAISASDSSPSAGVDASGEMEGSSVSDSVPRASVQGGSVLSGISVADSLPVAPIVGAGQLSAVAIAESQPRGLLGALKESSARSISTSFPRMSIQGLKDVSARSQAQSNPIADLIGAGKISGTTVAGSIPSGDRAAIVGAGEVEGFVIGESFADAAIAGIGDLAASTVGESLSSAIATIEGAGATQAISVGEARAYAELTVPGCWQMLFDTIRSRVQTEVGDAEGVPVHYGNDPGDTAIDTVQVVHSIEMEDTVIARIGGNNTFKKLGDSVVEIKVPIARGESEGLDLADKVALAFRSVKVSGVIFDVPSRVPSERRGAFYVFRVECPFRFDEVAAKINNGAVQVTAPNFEQSAAVIRDRFETLITTAESIPTQFENAPPIDIVDRMAVLTILPVASRQVEKGQTKTYRHPGIMIAQLFDAVETGDANIVVIADIINEQFRAVTDRGVKFRAPTVDVIGRRNSRWQINVRCPFYSEEIV